MSPANWDEMGEACSPPGKGEGVKLTLPCSGLDAPLCAQCERLKVKGSLDPETAALLSKVSNLPTQSTSPLVTK